MTRWLIIVVLVSMTIAAHAQLSGRGLIDGVYHFELDAFPAGDDVLEGQITYADIPEARIAFTMLKGDTLHIQEIDQYFNSVMHMALIRQGGAFAGYYFSADGLVQLPVQFHLDQQPIAPDYALYRYDVGTAKCARLFDVPLSPSNRVGKYIHEKTNAVHPYYTMTDGLDEHVIAGDRSHGELEKGNTVESVEAEAFYYTDGERSIEAIIPVFHQAFVDSLQSSLVRWKAVIEQHEKVDNASRFPTRYYAICDIDFWSDQYVAGSYEYIGPDGKGEGYTFVFDRKSSKFVDVDILVRSGSLKSTYPISSGLGLSFDRYGVIEKGRFHPVEGRKNKRHDWEDVPLKLKRKINQISR